MKKAKRLLAMLLCLCVVAGLMTTTASAANATVLEEAKVTLTAPVTGATPAKTATVPSDADYTVTNVEWEGSLSSGKFKANTVYGAYVTLSIKSGKNAIFSEKGFNAYVNGTLLNGVAWTSPGNEITLYAEFPKTAAAQTTAPTALSEAKITLTAPVTGKTPATTATVPSSADYTVKSVKWDGSLSSGKFKANTSYTAYVTLGIKSGKNATFSDKGFNAYVNNTLMDEVIWNSPTEIVVYAVFPKTAAAQVSQATKIDTIKLTVDAPAWGKKPAATAKLTAGDNGTVNSVVKDIKWSGELDIDGTFMCRTKYQVTFTMGIKSGVNYVFSDKSIKATINGKAADKVLWYSDDKVEVIYTFPAFGTGSTISNAWINMDGPAEGEKPATTAHLASTSSIYVSNVRWEGALDSSGRFQAGTEYTAYLTLKVKDEFKDRKFTTKSLTAHVNGVQIKDTKRVSDREYLVTVEFEKTEGTAPATTATFTDVASGDYFAQPVRWAVDKKITTGTSKDKFSPNQNCTQAQILTFLWRAAGSPEPKGTVTMQGFTGNEYYYKAAMWAAENDMVEGNFNPDAPCTRSMAVTFMWKHAGSPSAPSASFTDVPANSDYAKAVAWAVAKNVTTGTSSTQFSPAKTCTRGQIATFLYRAFAN